MKENLDLIKVLLVDDDPEDIDLTMEVMEMTKIKVEVEVASDGIEAMDYLNKVADNGSIRLPDLILLDLNMPRMNGHEVLENLKADDRFKQIPVVILTTSKSENDIFKSYYNGVSCFISKPVGLSQFQEVVEAINSFWFTIVRLPKKEQ
ncbi:MAG: response regulator [Draconibacterium sp.]|nr:response regulator [Draconibacterium sp.]